MLSSFFVPEDEDAFVRWVGKMHKRKDVTGLLAKWKFEFQQQEKERGNSY